MFKKRRNEKRMCDKLRELNGKRPEYFSTDLRSLPINIDKILLDNGIDIFSVEFDMLEKSLPIKNLLITGMAYAKGDDLRILSAQGLQEVDRRFTLAHELGHCCTHMKPTHSCHIELQTNYDMLGNQNQKIEIINVKKEEEADAFARNLLIPQKLLLCLLSERNDFTIEELSEIFMVPIKQMEKKMEELFNDVSSRSLV